MERPLISIVVPIYNAHYYLAECIESVLAILGNQWELLLIDDGSVDDSAKICKYYADKDSRISYFYQSNSGVSEARNTGIFHAKGLWITFLDADDCLMPNVINIVEKVSENVELIIFGYSRENLRETCLGDNIFLNQIEVQQSILNIKRFLKLHRDIHVIDGYNSWSCWGRLYKTDIVKEQCILFPNGLKRSEDLLFSLRYSSKIQTVIVNNSIGYYYRNNSDSVTQRYAEDLEESTKRVISEARKSIVSNVLKKDYATFIINNVVNCCSNYYLHPNTKWKLGECVKALELLCDDEEIRKAIEVCEYSSIAIGKKNTIQNIGGLWLLKKSWYRGMIIFLKFTK